MPLSVPQIKKALREKKLTYREVAERAGLDTSTIGKNVLKIPGNKSMRARRAIADAIELPVEQVFGDAA